MNIKPKHDFKPCVPGAFTGGLWRTEFFDGMVLSEADMKREQSYWQMKRRLTNRALGQGVVWGLTVEWDEKARCFTVCPGYGLSCCGDDLIVECPQTVCERDLIDPCSADFRKLLADRADPSPPPAGPVEACLMLEYVECPEDPRQVFEDPCARTPQGCRYGAVRETTRLRLVPPPAPEPKGLIERFCEKIAQIRKSLAEAGVNLPDPIFPPTSPSLALSVAALDASDTALNAMQARVGGEMGGVAQVAMSADTADKVRVGLEPAPGYMFVAAKAGDVDVSGAPTMMGVFDTHAATALTGAGVNRTIEVEMASLFGTSDGLRVRYAIEVRRSDAGTTLSARVLESQSVKRRVNCASLLADGLYFKGDVACTLRTLVLALLCGWFRGLLGSPHCADDGKTQPSRAQAIVAWLICWLAWRVIFGIDIAKDNAANVEKCLQLLFLEWCKCFHYKGPRCDCYAHGIILGCMQISPKGRILCFDEWEHRRYVLTGPLITHWAGQFGLAPLDVTATRLASWICCVAHAPMPARADFVFAPGSEAFVPLGGAGVGFGKDFASSGAFRGVPVVATRTVPPTEFFAQAMRAMTMDAEMQVATAKAVERVSAAGLDVHLILPRDIARRTPFGDAISTMLQRELREAPVMARQPMADFVVAFAEDVTLSDLQLPSENALFDKMVSALDSAAIASVADLVALEPEAAIAKIRPKLAADPAFTERGAAEKTMSLVYNTAVRTLSGAADAVGTEAKGRPEDDAFTRAELTEPGTVAAVRKAVNAHLRGKGMTAAAVRALAARVVAARP